MLFALLGLAIVILITDILFCMKRGFFKSLVRVCTQALSYFLALVLAKPLARALSSSFLPMLEAKLFENKHVASYFALPGSSEEVMNAFGTMLFAPFIFLLLYIAFKLLTLIIYHLICGLFKIEGPKNKGASIGLGLLTGVASAFIGVLVVTVPVMGFATMTDNVVRAYGNADSYAVIQNAEDSYVSPVAQTPGVSQLFQLGGQQTFNMLTSATVKDKNTSLESELTVAVKSIDSLLNVLKKPVDSYTKEDMVMFGQVAADIGDSPILAELSALALHSIAEAWTDDESVLGLSFPSMADEAHVIMNGSLKVYVNITGDIIGSHLASTAKIFEEAAAANALKYLSNDAADGDFANHLVADDAVPRILAVLRANPNMKPLTDAFFDVSFRTLLRKLNDGDVANYRETHTLLMNDMAGALRESVNEGEINADALADLLQNMLALHGHPINNALAETVAAGLAETFAGKTIAEMTNDQIIDVVIARLLEALVVEL